MIGRTSIRARLTLTITALTMIAGALAVMVGLQSLEGQVRQRAVDAEVAEVADLNLAGLVEEGPVVLLEEGAEFAEEAEHIDDGSVSFQAADVSELLEALELADLTDEEIEALLNEGFFVEPLAFGARRTVDDLAEVGVADLVFDAFADDGLLHVLLLDGRIAVLEPGNDGIAIVTLDAIDDETVVVPQLDLEELAIVSIEQFDLTPDPDPIERDVQTAIVELDGLDVGLLVDVTDELDALDAIRVPLWFAAVALTLLAGLATWLLTGRALRPVVAITDRVAEITSGTLDGRVPEPGSGDEIGVLAQTMNHMLARLERTDVRRRQFVSDASHELRTPVAVLRSEAEVANRAPSTTTVEDFAAVVLGETARLEGLVEDLLALARADERRIETASSTFGFGEVDVDDVVLAEAKRTRRLPVDQSQVSAGRVRAKADDLARAVGHLLDNAVRHGESKVAVGVRTEGSRVRIWVDDDGTGIAQADRARVFDRFTRLDEARSRDRGGSGLGLAVVAETVAGLGGTVTIDQGPLGGARVAIDLPGAVPAELLGGAPVGAPTRVTDSGNPQGCLSPSSKGE